MSKKAGIPAGAFQSANKHTCSAWVGNQGGNGRNCYCPGTWIFRGEYFCTRHVKEPMYWPRKLRREEAREMEAING